MAQLVKTVDSLAIASVKTWGSLAIASAKTIMGVDNTGGGGGGNLWVTALTPGSTTSGFSGEMGCLMDVGATPITIYELGRYKLSGNNQVHNLSIYNVALAQQATVAVDMSQAADGNGYVWGVLGTPFAPTPSTSYFIVTEEDGAGDTRQDDNCVLTLTGVASIQYSVYRSGTSGAFNSNALSKMYGTVNMKTLP